MLYHSKRLQSHRCGLDICSKDNRTGNNTSKQFWVANLQVQSQEMLGSVARKRSLCVDMKQEQLANIGLKRFDSLRLCLITCIWDEYETRNCIINFLCVGVSHFWI